MVNMTHVLERKVSNQKDGLQQKLFEPLENLNLFEEGSHVNLLKGKLVLDLYQPYDELEIDSNEE